jgi:chromate transporter
MPARIFEVFLAFLRLGLTSFGGPIAHLAYFRAEFVTRRKWLDEAAFGEIVGLCQFLPGPASSQTGFAIGLLRAGFSGGIAAWTAFTAPSAILMLAAAYGGRSWFGTPVGAHLSHGLKLAAVAVVAQAVWRLGRSLCPDRVRATFAFAAAISMLLFSSQPYLQVALIALGAAVGMLVIQNLPEAEGVPAPIPFSRNVSRGAFAIFAALLILSFLPVPHLEVFSAFYRPGALVFGGGHVVLPLLENTTVAKGWVSQQVFLAGYGVAQAVPGPLFTFAAFLGAMLNRAPNGILGGLVALIALFLPGLLLVIAVLPFWGALRMRPFARAALAGVNATVVGLLLAALYDPVWTGSVTRAADVAVVVAAFAMLEVWSLPAWVVVVGTAAVGLAA